MNDSNCGMYDPNTWDDNDCTTWRWQVDHIIPKCFFDFETEDDEIFKQCWSLSNLRALSAKQNIKEGNRRNNPNRKVK